MADLPRRTWPSQPFPASPRLSPSFNFKLSLKAGLLNNSSHLEGPTRSRGLRACLDRVGRLRKDSRKSRWPKVGSLKIRGPKVDLCKSRGAKAALISKLGARRGFSKIRRRRVNLNKAKNKLALDNKARGLKENMIPTKDKEKDKF